MSNDDTSWVHIKAAAFKKSSFSEGGGDCFEVAHIQGIAMRDSKNLAGPVLWFTPREWTAFIDGILTGEFD